MEELEGTDSRPDESKDAATAVAEPPGDGAATRKLQFQEKLLSGIGQLDRSIADLADRVDEVSEFAVKAKDALFTKAEHVKIAARQPLLESLFRIHDALFTRVQAMETGHEQPEPFAMGLLDSIEGELGRNGVEILRPQPGDEPSWDVMEAIGSRKKPFWRRTGAVAAVHRCGFAECRGRRRTVLRKAEIDAYKD